MNDRMSSSDAADRSSAAEPFPEARLVENTGGRVLLAASRMWWLTLVCLLAAIVLVWRSLPAHGLQIAIQFPEGHGLKAGDAVRYRGVDVGHVQAVELSEELDRVIVQVELRPGSEALAKVNSRFWIVRPQLSLTEVSGLETAVGAKYIAVSPGELSGRQKLTFDGLATAPPDEFHDHGLTVVLQSDQRHGISSGAPVRWRGVEVGQVLSAGLSADARHVNITVRIRSSYRRLVQTSSRFWVTSGFNVDVGLSGLHLNADSLSTIARGGVSLITPESTSDERVRNGQIFKLHDKVDEDWFESAAATPLVDFELPETVTVTGVRESSLLGIARQTAFQQHGLITSVGSQRYLWTADMRPADQIRSDDDDDSRAQLPDLKIHSAVAGSGAAAAVELANLQPGQWSRTQFGILRVAIDESAMTDLKDAGVAAAERLPDAAVDVVIVSTAADQDTSVPVVKPVDRAALNTTDAFWTIDEDVADDLDLEAWHGAPVVSSEAGVIIGLLLVRPDATIVAPLTDSAEP